MRRIVAVYAALVAGCGPGTDTEGTSVETAILSIGSSFGECMGACLRTVTFDPRLTLTLDGWSGENYPILHVGVLTADGAAELAGVDGGLATAVLDPVYGCPDCADGGAMALAYDRDGTVAETQWEYGDPPEPLIDVDALFHHLHDALEACAPTEWVEPDPACVPF